MNLADAERLQGQFPSLDNVSIAITDPVPEGPPDLIPGLLPKYGTLVIAGETNIGKSLLSLEIISSLVTGNLLWGELKPNQPAEKVLYILGEHHLEVIQRLAAHTGLPMTKDVRLVGPEQIGYDKWLVAGGKPNLRGVDKFKFWAEGMDLIVWDPLSAFCFGESIENDNVQMRLVLDSMSLVAQSAGAACIILAHQGKPMMDKQGQEQTRKSYAVRGASGIEDAATNIFYMGRAEGASAAAAETRDSKIITLKCRKYKGNAPDEYRLMRDNATLCHTLLGNRPFVEVRKIETQAKATRIQMSMPDLKMNEVIRILAATDGLSETTIRRYLEG